jgi:site-specific recombinase XerD
MSQNALPPSIASDGDEDRNQSGLSIQDQSTCVENLAVMDRLTTHFETFIEYEKYVLNHSQGTIRLVHAGFRNLRKYLDTHVTLDPEHFLLKLYDLDSWVAWNRKRGLQPITVNSTWRSLRTFFTFRAERFAAPNPYAASRTPRFQPPLPKALTAVQCERILGTARCIPWENDYERSLVLAVIGVMLYAGLRLGEVLRLRDAEVNLGDRTIRIVRGKGTHGGRDRMAMINAPLAATLITYLRERATMRLDGIEFFVNHRTRNPLGQITVRRVVQRIREVSGVNWSPHRLRHSFVTHLLMAGVPIHLVQDLAGHRNIATTLGYTAIFDPDRKEAIEKLKF